jgi:hypothetical protein
MRAAAVGSSAIYIVAIMPAGHGIVGLAAGLIRGLVLLAVLLVAVRLLDMRARRLSVTQMFPRSRWRSCCSRSVTSGWLAASRW